MSSVRDEGLQSVSKVVTYCLCFLYTTPIHIRHIKSVKLLSQLSPTSQTKLERHVTDAHEQILQENHLND